MSALEKLVESIIKVTKHIEEQALLKQSQHGFCKCKSCLINLLEFFESFSKHINKGDLGDIVCLDFQKAIIKDS